LGQEGVAVFDARGPTDFPGLILDFDLFGHVQVKTRRPVGIASLVTIGFGAPSRRLPATPWG
jgi:hypothetical protein